MEYPDITMVGISDVEKIQFPLAFKSYDNALVNEPEGEVQMNERNEIIGIVFNDVEAPNYIVHDRGVIRYWVGRQFFKIRNDSGAHLSVNEIVLYMPFIVRAVLLSNIAGYYNISKSDNGLFMGEVRWCVLGDVQRNRH